MSHWVFDEDIFVWLTSFSLRCHLTHTRGISLFSDDDDVLAELSKLLMKLMIDPVSSRLFSPVKSCTGPSLQEDSSEIVSINRRRA